MIPISLTLEGVYSYRAPQTIDFSQLTASKLFGIFGAVGSGKSTILEAITIALYGDTERLNNRESRGYNMMNLQSNKMKIDYEFEAKNQRYKFIYEAKRNSKRFEDVKPSLRQAYQLVNAEWAPISAESGSEIIGLSYQNFKRTIIIPQGKFKEFLSLGTADRIKMLEEVFQLGKYDFSSKVGTLEKANNEKKQNLEGQLIQLKEVSEEDLALKKTQLVAAQPQVDSYTKSLALVQTKIQDVEAILARTKELATAKQALADCNKKSAFYISLETKVNNYEYALIHFKPLLDNLNRTQKQEATLQKTVQDTAHSHESTKTQLIQLQEVFKPVKEAHIQRDQFLKKAEALKTSANLIEVNGMLASINGSIAKGRVFLEEQQRLAAEATSEQQAIETALEKLKKSMPNASELMNVLGWFRQKGHIVSNITESADALKKLNTSKQVQVDKRTNLLSESTSLLKQAERIDHAHLLECITAKKEQLAFLVQSKNDLVIQHKLKNWAEQLQPNTPCTLCGSTNHPAPLNIATVEEDLLAVDQKIDLVEKECSSLEKTVLSIEGLDMLLSEIEEQIKSESLKQSKLAQQLEQHMEAFHWTKYSPTDENQITKAQSELEAGTTKVNNIEGELKKCGLMVKSAESNVEKAQAKIKKYEVAFAAEAGKKHLLEQQIPADLHEKHKHKDAAELRTEAKKIEASIETNNHNFERLDKAIDENANQLTALETSLSNFHSQLKMVAEECKEITNTLSEAVHKSNFETTNEIKDLLEQPIDVSHQRAQIDDFKKTIQKHTASIELISNQLKGKVYDQNYHLSLQQEQAATAAKIAELNKTIGALKSSINQLEEQLQTKKTLTVELNEVDSRGNDITTLKRLFKSKGFVNYVSTVYLKNLCIAANNRFMKMTKQQLSLELTAENGFDIRDYLNEGKVRHVKTLSGGQTFQAALCLALALADSVQQQNEQKENFFFLDEGFGTLDKDTLHTVFDSLKALRKENRIVGIISHVEGLQQEIDVALKVENTDEHGSIISLQ